MHRMNFEDFKDNLGKESLLTLLSTATLVVQELVRRGLPLRLSFEILKLELNRVVTALELFGKEGM